ncbi:hypothetical protein ECSTEC7V_2889 [Escherichia coli STEC_7v]|nr:hypothetical protein ECSTEC7V_2889 [Escherichia coli STEC_7v]
MAIPLNTKKQIPVNQDLLFHFYRITLFLTQAGLCHQVWLITAISVAIWSTILPLQSQMPH